MSDDHFDDFKLPPIEHIKKIGEFKVNDKVVIGDTDFCEIKLQPGTYEAYKVNDDNLMIINANLMIQPDESIVDWTWHHTGEGVGVDTGCFGFYDRQTVKSIMKYDNETECDLPLVDERVSMKDLNNGIIVDGSHMTEDLKPEERDQYGPFGVIMSTGTGDGGFECFTIGDDRALLLGKITGYKIYGDKENG